METKEYPNEDLIFIQGETDSRLYKLQKGKVAIYLAFQNILLLDVITQPMFFGIAPLTGGVHKYTAECIDEATIDILDYEKDEIGEQQTLLMNQLAGKIRSRLEQEDIQGISNLLNQMDKFDTISERFFSRFFPYKLVRDTIRELRETGQIARTEKGIYQKSVDKLTIEEGW